MQLWKQRPSLVWEAKKIYHEKHTTTSHLTYKLGENKDQLSSVTQSYLTLCNPMDCSTPGFPVHHQLPELPQLMSIKLVMPPNCLILCHPLSPGVCSNSCSLSQCCYLTISSSASPFFCLQLFPASGSFPVSQPFASGGQSIGASAWASVLSVNSQGWFPSGWTGLFSLQSKRLSRVYSNTMIWRHQLFIVQLSHPYMTTGKTIPLTIGTFAGKAMSLIFKTLSRFGIAFFLRSKPILLVQIPFPFRTCINH